MSPSLVIGYILGAVMVVLGSSVVAGLFDSRGGMFAEPTARTVFGVVLILYGIYRIGVAYQARRRATNG